MRDVVVIGGGFAGLSAALAERGARVTILESRPRLGGRASSFRDAATGTVVDNGQHASWAAIAARWRSSSASARAARCTGRRACTSISAPASARASSTARPGRARSTWRAACCAIASRRAGAVECFGRGHGADGDAAAARSAARGLHGGRGAGVARAVDACAGELLEPGRRRDAQRDARARGRRSLRRGAGAGVLSLAGGFAVRPPACRPRRSLHGRRAALRRVSRRAGVDSRPGGGARRARRRGAGCGPARRSPAPRRRLRRAVPPRRWRTSCRQTCVRSRRSRGSTGSRRRRS